MKTWTVVGTLLCLAMGLGLSGCYEDNCELRLTCPYLEDAAEAEEPQPRCELDPAEGEVHGDCGVWVSSSLGDDANDGTPAAPVATLAQAITLAGPGGRAYVCAEELVEQVELPAGVSLFGGFDCTELQWRYVGHPMLTKLTAPADVVPLVLVGSASQEVSTVADFAVTAADASVPGGSSIAVLARQDANALILRGWLASGNGADGADGGDGDHVGHPAPKGLSGEDGMAACSAKPGLGGTMVGMACGDDGISSSGQGGDGGELSANPGGDGKDFLGDNPQGFGLGGLGEDPAMGLACTPGIGGAAGADGEYGWGAVGPGHLTNEGYVGVWGGNGTAGRPGQGGGGGGASAAKLACGAAPHGGAGGGSGGMGGCGGKGGRGGQPGGASIGLASLSSSVTVRDVMITAGNGGDGGRGGALQSGGQGGLPGIGGAGLGGVNGANPGCGGGIGGYGGDGGHGGGGLGGPSLAIADLGGQTVSIFGQTLITHGQGGSGGPGANPGIASTNGQAGLAARSAGLLP